MNPFKRSALLLSVLFIAMCGILYELLISSISSYLLGSSIYHFSITIGLFMFFMGLGSYLSKYLKKNILQTFIVVELVLSIVGGASCLVLHLALIYTKYYGFLSGVLIAIIGTLIGTEIPLIARLLENKRALKDTIAEILSFDYIGALIASLLFPIVLLPYLGTMRTALVISFINIIVALLGILIFQHQLKRTSLLVASCAAIIGLQIFGFVYSLNLVNWLEDKMYQDPIIYSHQSSYQRIVLTKYNTDIRLFLNGHLQFCSQDEYRYHEVLAHLPVLYSSQAVQTVLILGGGDGLLAKQLLKYPSIQSIRIVDLDAEVTTLAQENRYLTALNDSAFYHPKVKISNTDAFNFLKEPSTTSFDLIVADLPDPNDVSLGKLYSKSFYQLIQKHLNPKGIFITQSTSPFFAPNTYWCIHQTLETVFPHVRALHCNVPSFGEWGFQMASLSSFNDSTALNVLEQSPLKFQFLNTENFKRVFAMDNDFQERPTQISTLDDLSVVHYYNQELLKWH